MHCRACAAAVEPVVDLGSQPAGGSFPYPGDPPDERLALRLGTCTSCGLVQLADPSPSELDELDGPSPLASRTMSSHARGFVDDLIARDLAGPTSRILSIASHGGHLAPFLAERGLSATILEASPARAAHISVSAAQVVTGDLDGLVAPAGLAPGSFDLVVDNYLLAHLARPRVALSRLVGLVAPGGTLVLEFDYLMAIVEGGQWDAVRHGHQVYLALGWLSRELAALGLEIVDAVPQTVYGGALRVYARSHSVLGEGVPDQLAHEAEAGIHLARGLVPLMQAAELARREVVEHLRTGRDAGRRVAGYGAPARSVTFLNALGIGPDLLPYVVDRATSKQGRTIPGVRIPIRAPHALQDDAPDEILVLVWDLVREVRDSLAIPVLANTRFLVAVPRLLDVTDPGGVRTRPISVDPVR